MPIHWTTQHTLAQGRWLGKIKGRERAFSLYEGAVPGNLSARITNQVLLVSRRGYRLRAAGRVKQFEDFSLGKENDILLSAELLKLKNYITR